MSEPIVGEVLRILDRHTLIISVGREHNVRKGMRFIVYEEADEIVNPKTQEKLGKLEMFKGEVEVLHVQDKFCIATSERYYVSRPIFEAITRSLYTSELRYRELPINDEDIEPLSAAVSKTIKVGDKVKQIA